MEPGQPEREDLTRGREEGTASRRQEEEEERTGRERHESGESTAGREESEGSEEERTD